MSTSIRPPTGSPGGPSGIEGAADVAATGDVAASGEVARSQTVAPEARAGAAQGPTAEWLARLEANEITRAEAIEGLVAQAIESHGGARLAPAQRAELEAVLRSALLEDPVLSRLLGG